MLTAVLIATGAYAVTNFLIGFWKLRSTDFASYVSSRSSMGGGVIGLSIVGTAVGGGMFFAVSQMGYEAGLAVLALPVSYLLGYLLLLRAVPRIRKYLSQAGGHTLYDVVEFRFKRTGSGARGYLALLALVTLGMYGFMLAGQFAVLAVFYMDILDVSRATAWGLSLGVVAGTTLAYSVVGGIKKDVATDIFQMAVTGIGLVLICAYSGRILVTDYGQLPKSYFNLTGYGVLFPIGILLFFSPAFLGRYDYWQRIIAARDDASAKRGLWLSFPLIGFAYIVFCVLGLFVRAVAPDIQPSQAGLWGLRTLLPGWAFLAAILAIYGAVMSTADTLLNVAGVSAYRLLSPVLPLGMKRGSLLGVRLTTLGVGFSASLMVILAPDIVDLIVGGFSSLVILVPSLVVVLFFQRPNSRCGALSLGLGYLVFILLFAFAADLRKYAFMGGFVVAMVPVLVSLLVRLVKRQTIIERLSAG